MGFPKGASIPFGRERGSNPVREFKLITAYSFGEAISTRMEWDAKRAEERGRRRRSETK
jgi:hypothetical protein